MFRALMRSIFPTPPEVSGSGPAISARVALVVDDDAELKKAIGRLLRTEGFTVHSAENGAEALDLLKKLEGGVSVLVTDHDMPRMTGSELMRSVRAENLLVGMMVGLSANPANEAAFKAAGAHLVFDKPFVAATIINSILEALQKP